MKKFIAASFAVTCITLAVACGSNGPTVSGPDPVTVSAPEPVVAAPAPVPQTVVPPSGTFSATYFPNAGFQVTNLSGESKSYYAYYTSFDNQTTALGVITGLNTKNGKDFTGSFNKTCVQLDLTEEATVVGGPGGRAFAYAYFDKQGKEISNANRNEKIAECRTPDPRPTPTPPACEPTFTSREATTYIGEGCLRVKRVTTYRFNSCTKEETSTYVDTPDPQSSDYYTGEFKIDSLSDSGFLYYITDDGVLSPLWQDLRLTYVNKNALGAYHYSHALDGSVLALSHQVGLLGKPFSIDPADEFIGQATASCGNTNADWHGKVSFVCTKHNTCEQNQ